jgi:8-oxo-dGTP diphosphatase
MSAKIQIVLFFYFVFWQLERFIFRLLMLEYSKSIHTDAPGPNKDAASLVSSYPKVPLTVDCVIFGFINNTLNVLLIKSDLAQFKDELSLLGDMVQSNEDLDTAANRVLLERTGMHNVFLEQVHTFSKVDRHPGGRVITTVYASLLNFKHQAFKIHENELKWHEVNQISSMAFDHKHILDVCYTWLQKRIQEHPLAFSLLPEKFSLRQLQNVYEAILNTKLDRRNFRKKFASMGLLIDTNEMEVNVTHRPGKLYQFDYAQYETSKRNWVGIDF